MINATELRQKFTFTQMNYAALNYSKMRYS